ncbi:uncharacterized protein LOC133447388 [Cololabis saira]|uniref:uncharacterized protein LOC133447388 n=1 Tax=Cololabis saira TaxID=129043 RepID=UPI002AD22330|nr:uncharacterized protein LOC133447388 [Cololabis saira]
MPQKGKRSRAQKLRWSKPDEVTQPETPPPAQPFWTQRDGASPSQSPAQKMKKLWTPLPISPSFSPYQAGRVSPSDFRPGHGTGHRHRVLKWDKSTFTPHFRKLVVPAESPDKKFVLLVGDSHLRPIADGLVGLPDRRLSCGVLSVPGASALELRTEVLNAVLPRSPAAVCILAPSNDLSASGTVTQAGVAFGKLLLTACSTWPNVCVLDFPRRLTVELDLQELLSQEYHRVAARMGVRSISARRVGWRGLRSCCGGPSTTSWSPQSRGSRRLRGHRLLPDVSSRGPRLLPGRRLLPDVSSRGPRLLPGRRLLPDVSSRGPRLLPGRRLLPDVSHQKWL